MAPQSRAEIHGHVAAGFEAVRQVFADNFTLRRELGAACCVCQHGEKVVDLWGGLRDSANRTPWAEDMMVMIYSATKGLAAMVMALAHSRGWLDYDERVCTYWPEFAQNGKEHITVRQLLSHQAGLFALDEPVDRAVVADLDRLAAVLARQKPAWAPGERQAYHALSLGFYESELRAASIPSIEVSGRFSRMRSLRPWGWTSIFASRSRSPTQGRRPWNRRTCWRCFSACRYP
jgi:CubicO group peptidase (beta-lactamase class C family)